MAACIALRNGIPGLTLLMIVFALAVGNPVQASEDGATLEPDKDEALFLDRLMKAESAGKLNARNPKSSALGPFQFIESTFYDVITRNMPSVAQDKTYAEIQLLRTDLEIARSAALAYTRENAAFLNRNGIAPEAAHLRLAFLIGPSGAEAVISAKPETPVSNLLSAKAINANPFMNGMTAEQLIDRAKREAAGLKPLPIRAVNRARSAHPAIKVRCNLKLASCRKWLFL